MNPLLKLLLKVGLRLCKSADQGTQQAHSKRLSALTSRATKAYERAAQHIDRLYRVARSENNHTLTKALGLLVGVGIGAGAGLLLASTRQTDSEDSLDTAERSEKVAESEHIAEANTA